MPFYLSSLSHHLPSTPSNPRNNTTTSNKKTTPFSPFPKIPKVSLNDDSLTTPSKTPNKALWVNPNNPNAAKLRRNSSASRTTRLAKLAASLDLSDPTQSSVASILATLGESPFEQDAVIVLDLMRNPRNAVIALSWFCDRVRLDKMVILYNVTFKVLRKAKDWDGVVSLWNEMLEKGIRPDNVTFSTVICCARFCDVPEKAVEWFEKMGEFECEPDVVTYSVMIDAYGRSGNVELGLRLYDKAREERWRLDPVTFATVIRVYSMSGNFDGALNVYEEMKAMGVRPNLVIYNTLFDAMGRAGRPWQVKILYKDMIGRGLVPNRNTYAALLRAYSKALYAEDALAIYAEMKEKGVEMNVVLYNMLLSMCADLGSIDEAMSIFNEMKNSTGVNMCKPDSFSYSSLITAYSSSGKVSEAEKMLDEMLESGIQPNIFVLTSLIQCYGKAGKFDSAVRTFGKLPELDIIPDDRFCGCLLNVATLAPMEELGKIVDCIERANSQLGSLVKLLIDEKTALDVVRRDAKELLSNVSIEVQKAYCNSLIDLCVNLNQLEMACVLLDIGLHLGIYRDLQSKSATQWSLHVKSLSLGAALTALHVWMNDLTTVLQNGEDLPPLLGIHTGHRKHKYADKNLASVFQSRLRELKAPFHEAPDKVGWFLTTNIAAVSWLESRKSPELVAA